MLINNLMINLSELNTDDLEIIKNISITATQKYGEDPGTKEQAAANTAGHLLVAKVLGEEGLEALIWSKPYYSRTFWVGAIKRYQDANEDFSNIHSNPLQILKMAIQSLAGWAGETAANLDHPASCVEEKYKHEKYCTALEQAEFLPLYTYTHRITDFLYPIFWDYRNEFNTAKELLINQNKINTAEVLTILANVESVDLTSTFYGRQH